MTRGRWASAAIFLGVAAVGMGAFLVLGWTWRGVATFFLVFVTGSVIADRVFQRLASDAEKKEEMEARLHDLG